MFPFLPPLPNRPAETTGNVRPPLSYSTLGRIRKRSKIRNSRSGGEPRRRSEVGSGRSIAVKGPRGWAELAHVRCDARQQRLVSAHRRRDQNQGEMLDRLPTHTSEASIRGSKYTLLRSQPLLSDEACVGSSALKQHCCGLSRLLQNFEGYGTKMGAYCCPCTVTERPSVNEHHATMTYRNLPRQVLLRVDVDFIVRGCDIVAVEGRQQSCRRLALANHVYFRVTPLFFYVVARSQGSVR